MSDRTVDVHDTVSVHTVLRPDERIDPMTILQGESVLELPGLRTENVGYFHIHNIHTLGYVFNTTTVLLGGVIEYEDEYRIVLCTIDLGVFEANPTQLVSKLIRENGHWYLAQKIGELPSG